MNISRIIFIISFLLTGCSVNRVNYIASQTDIKSFAIFPKVPVVYGITVKKDSLPIKSYERFGYFPVFQEYSPKTKKTTAGCFGTANRIYINFHEKNKKPDDEKIYYYVLMVPPGNYARMGEVTQYFSIKSEHPQYLGNFVISKISRAGTFSGTASNLRMEYNLNAAKKSLETLNLNSKQLNVVSTIPDQGFNGGFVCAP